MRVDGEDEVGAVGRGKAITERINQERGARQRNDGKVIERE